MFDSSVTRGTTFKFELGRGAVIRGWDDGFATMRRGEKAFLQCAPEYAYGAAGSPPKIPPNATLRFEVELIGFGPKKKAAWEMTNGEKVAEAARAKDAGNAAFTSGDLRGALEEYQAGWRAIEYVDAETSYDALGDADKAALASLRVVLHSNSAAAHLRAGAYGEAIKAASTALKYDATHAKSLFRRGSARASLGLVEEAKVDLAAAARAAPGDAGIRAELDRVAKLVAAARDRERKAFGGIFAKGFSLDEPARKPAAGAGDAAPPPGAAAADAAHDAAAAPAAAAAGGGDGDAPMAAAS